MEAQYKTAKQDEKDDVTSALSAGIAQLFRRISPVKGRAFLFGSRARGDARQDSDWDVLLLLDKDRLTADDMNEVSYPIRELGWSIDAAINPIMYTVKDWEKRSSTPFYKNVMREGIPLWT